MNLAGKIGDMVYRPHILVWLLLSAFCLGMLGTAFAGEDVPSAEEQVFLELMNAARQDPLSVAESLGMDREQVLEALPDLKEVLTYGLPPLVFNEGLYASADAHTEEMLANSYFKGESLDGRGPEERITASGYEALDTGESLGMLGFNNFIEPETAVGIIFNKMFRDELDPSRKIRRNILDPELREVGISIGSGPFYQAGAMLNAYLVTCDFGAPSDLYVIERGLWRLINEARRFPLEALEKAGIAEAVAREVLGDEAGLLDIGLPPLAWHRLLFRSALRHNRDMIERLYYSTVCPDGTTPGDRIVSAGYDEEAPYADESLGFFLFEASDDPEGAEDPETPLKAVDPLEVAERIFETVLREELDPESDRPLRIFSREPVEVGIAVSKMLLPVEPDSLSNDVLYAGVVDLARPKEPTTYVIGNVFHDLDLDGIFGPGEGVAGLRVVLEDYSGTALAEAYSDSQGSYQLAVPLSGFMYLVVKDGDGGILEKRFLFWGQGTSHLVDMLIPVQEEEMKDPETESVQVPPTYLAITW